MALFKKGKKNNKKTKNKLSDEEITMSMRQEGAELAIYLHRLKWPDQAKEKILDGLKNFNLKEILVLKEILKEAYIRQESAIAPEKVEKMVEKSFEEMVDRQDKLNQATLGKLRKLREKVEETEKANA